VEGQDIQQGNEWGRSISATAEKESALIQDVHVRRVVGHVFHRSDSSLFANRLPASGLKKDEAS
jgi:hypothetical protein